MQGASFATGEPFLRQVADDSFRAGKASKNIEKLWEELEASRLSAFCQPLAPRPAHEEIRMRVLAVPRDTFNVAGLSDAEAQFLEAGSRDQDCKAA